MRKHVHKELLILEWANSLELQEIMSDNEVDFSKKNGETLFPAWDLNYAPPKIVETSRKIQEVQLNMHSLQLQG